MANFQISLPVLLAHEGSEYTDDPLDPGGATKYGITIPDLPPGATAADIQALTTAQAGAIYQASYWSRIRGDEIQDQNFATCYLDMAVLKGLTGATMPLRQALGLTLPAVNWGHLDDQTLAAINAANPKQLAFDFLWLLDQKSIAIFAATASQVKWLPGWLRRTHHLSSIVQGLNYQW